MTSWAACDLRPACPWLLKIKHRNVFSENTCFDTWRFIYQLPSKKEEKIYNQLQPIILSPSPLYWSRTYKYLLLHFSKKTIFFILKAEILPLTLWACPFCARTRNVFFKFKAFFFNRNNTYHRRTAMSRPILSLKLIKNIVTSWDLWLFHDICLCVGHKKNQAVLVDILHFLINFL